MRWNTVIMLGLAAVFGLAAVLAGQRWVARQAAQPRAVAERPEAPAVAMGTLVVAAQPLRYGTEVTKRHLREMPWPVETLPAGAFRTIAEVFDGHQGRRVALTAVEPNEPVLASKMTGTGQRATLSNVLEDGMGAVTVQVNEVVGVAGFVMPGDRVDLLLTRRPPSQDGPGAAPPVPFSDVVVQNLRVLAVGQIADERSDKPFVVNAVTLEVDPVAAQKVALAASAGALSLMLRKAGDVAARAGRRVSATELGQDSGPADSHTATVRVTRGTKREEYSVPTLEAGRRQPARFPQLATAAP